MPEVHDQIDSGLCAVVPSFVIEWVVEDYAFTLFKLFCFVANSHSGAFSAKDWEMDAEFLTSWAIVRSYVSARSYGGEETMSVISWNDLFEDFDGFGDLS